MGGGCEEEGKDSPKGRFQKEKSGEEGQRISPSACFQFSTLS